MKKKNVFNPPKTKRIRLKFISKLKVPKDLTPININDLNFNELVYLGSVMSSCQFEYFPFVIVNTNKTKPLAPNSHFLHEIFLSLLNRKILVIADSPCNAIPDKKYKEMLISATEITFYVNVGTYENIDILGKILHPLINLKEKFEEIKKFWKILIIEECKGYLYKSFNSVDFNYTLNDRYDTIFEKCVENLSVSQIMHLIKISLGYTTLEYQAGRIIKLDAENYFFGNFLRQYEIALINKIGYIKYERPIDFPESYLTSYFFIRVLRSADSISDLMFSITKMT